ncbi:MAG: hypothetical protein HYU60_07610 [Magnetospirillum sp.]|nr:hypothetical protein [Magnetospirillum sp.]
MTRWVEEFRAEIDDDRRCLLEARQQRAGTSWSFAVAAERTRRYYIERITGFFVCGSVTEAERDELLRLVDGLTRE